MLKIERITTVLALILVISTAAFADGPSSPACEPGIMHGPPCATAQMNDDATPPGQTQTPPVADGIDVISEIEVALIELLILW